MDIIRIHGPSHLDGEINIQGSKNAALPMMAAAVLNGGKTVIKNCPDISDIRASVDILKYIGCNANFKDNTLTVDSSGDIKNEIPQHLMCRLRSSFLFTGAVLARCGKVISSMPGGCNIGARPVDIHLSAFKRLGAEVNFKGDFVEIKCVKTKPCDVFFRLPSVGATENIMIFASLGNSKIRILNAACEPEIKDLQNMLNSMGADIKGAGTPCITVKGVKKLNNTEYTVMPDRIVCATYLTALACSNGNIGLNGAVAQHISPYIALLRRCGMKIDISDKYINAEKKSRLCGSVCARTKPYPGFATDIQSLVMSAMSVSNGVSVIQENIFENRFNHADLLKKMGADISVRGKSATICGVKKLKNVCLDAYDLRSGAALAAAMLAAEGDSEIGNIHYIDRGYENFEKCLNLLGAKTERIEKI